MDLETLVLAVWFLALAMLGGFVFALASDIFGGDDE